MPKLKEHNNLGKFAGVVASGVYGLYVEDNKWNTVFYLLGGFAGRCICSRIPDFLEPSKELGPNHRGVWHSVAGNVSMGYAGYKATSF